MTQSIPRKLFGRWLEGKMGEGQIRQTDLAKSAKLDEAMVSRAIHGTHCSYQTAKKLIKALNCEPDQVLAELSEAEETSPEADLESLCKTLQIIGGYPSVEAALKAAVRREVLAQETAKEASEIPEPKVVADNPSKDRNWHHYKSRYWADAVWKQEHGGQTAAFRNGRLIGVYGCAEDYWRSKERRESEGLLTLLVKVGSNEPLAEV